MRAVFSVEFRIMRCHLEFIIFEGEFNQSIFFLVDVIEGFSIIHVKVSMRSSIIDWKINIKQEIVL